MRKYSYLILISVVCCCLPNITFAQVFTFDYLTYRDQAFIPKKSKAYNLDTFLFFGTGEFDAAGKSRGDNISYKEYHVHFGYAFNFEEKFQFSIAPQLGGIYAEKTASISYGDIWFLGKYKFSRKVPIALRLGFKLGKIGKSFWLRQNDFDIGILASQSISSSKIQGIISYRIRGKSDFVLSDFVPHSPGRFNQPGNTFHYKFEFGHQFKHRLDLSVFLLGHSSRDKKFDDIRLPDSNSRKTTLGAAIKYKTAKGRLYKVGILLDVAGVNDKKGFGIAFTIRD